LANVTTVTSCARRAQDCCHKSNKKKVDTESRHFRRVDPVLDVGQRWVSALLKTRPVIYRFEDWAREIFGRITRDWVPDRMYQTNMQTICQTRMQSPFYSVGATRSQANILRESIVEVERRH
jgi:hypothetical protein